MGTRMWRYSNVLESTSMQSRALLCNVIPRHSRLFCATCLSDPHASQINARKAWLLPPRLPFLVSDWLSRSCGTLLPSYLYSFVCAPTKILRSIQARRLSQVLGTLRKFRTLRKLKGVFARAQPSSNTFG